MTHAILYRVLQTAFDELGLRHFRPEEFVPLRRDVPPFPYWGRIIPTAIVLNGLRVGLGCPVYVTSAYRPEWYNREIGGALHSRHVLFEATDIVARDVSPDGVYDWLAASAWGPRLGLGRYDTFTHIDTRHWVELHGAPARWDNRT
jgi:hypothetical protein